MADCPLNAPGCLYVAATGRHNHVAHDLIQIGQRCQCGVNSWRVMFGGLLPARVVCAMCGAGFNIGERLRTCGRDTAPISRKAGRW